MGNKETKNWARIYSVETMFTKWLQDELNKRNWSQSELARRAGLAHGTISNLLSGNKGVGEASLNAIAKAFHVPSDIVFRKAGLLPEIPESDELKAELLYLFDRLPDKEKKDMVSHFQIRVEILERDGRI